MYSKRVIGDRLSPDVFVNSSQLKPLVLSIVSGKNLISDLVSQLRSVSKTEVMKLLPTDAICRISFLLYLMKVRRVE